MFRITLILCLCAFLATGANAGQQEWRFRVLLDDREIGRHDFVLSESEDQYRIRSEANFDYRLFFVKLFEYRHENTETWSGNCLTAIESRTDVNGKPFRVTGETREGRLVLDGSSGVMELAGCNMSFAYWNPAFLKQEQLINVQTGEVLDVKVTRPEQVKINVRGNQQSALRYELTAGEMEIALWYSREGEWLALETEARGGRLLRYVLI